MSDRRHSRDQFQERSGHDTERTAHPVRIRLGSRQITLPRSRLLRVGLGVAFVLGGLVGFLPIVGFWMLPLGIMILSVDLPFARRWRRRLVVWWHRRRDELKREGDF